MAVTTDPATVLVLRALGLGDLLTGLPALRGLRRCYPSARIVLATPKSLEPLAMFAGAVDQVLPTRGLGDLTWPYAPPDLAVDLHGNGPESVDDLLATRPKRLLAYQNSRHRSITDPPWREDVHEVDRWCALLEWHGISCDPGDLHIDRPGGYPKRAGVVVIHPGAAAPARRWPTERFAAVACALAAAGHRVVVTGSREERALAEAVVMQARLPESALLAGELDVMGMVALISDCQLLVCGDTGVGHIATATATPSVLLFGPTPPNRWGPRGDGRHVTVWAGQRGDPHAEHPDPGLLRITPLQVIEATQLVLQECA